MKGYRTLSVPFPVWVRIPGKRLVNDLCTLSISLIKYICVGDQTGDEYSSRGRTCVMNARLRLTTFRDMKLRYIRDDRCLARVTKS